MIDCCIRAARCVLTLSVYPPQNLNWTAVEYAVLSSAGRPLQKRGVK